MKFVAAIELQGPSALVSTCPMIEEEGPMGCPAGHGAEVKRRIGRPRLKALLPARLRERFDRGHHGRRRVTHDGSYSHFESKSDLDSRTLDCFLTDPDCRNGGDGVHAIASATSRSRGVGRETARRALSPPLVPVDDDAARSHVAKVDSKGRPGTRRPRRAWLDRG